MNNCCIQLINPNTNIPMTDRILAAARQVAAPGTAIVAVCPAEGAPSIEGHLDEAIAAIGVLQRIKEGRDQGGWPRDRLFRRSGPAGGAELATAPVIGMPRRYAYTLVATVLAWPAPRTLVIARHLLHQYGFERHCPGCAPLICRCCPGGWLRLARQKVREQCLGAKREDGSAPSNCAPVWRI
jgi:allantoin racemase